MGDNILAGRTYSAKGNQVFADPVHTPRPGGTSISIGFCVCTVTEYVERPFRVAEAIAAAMTNAAKEPTT